jgi:tRNA (mo5U34)-methyltransferase
MNAVEAEKLVRQRNWHHNFEIYPGIFTNGSYNPIFMFEKLNIPNDLEGVTVLDIGASDGFYSLECLRRGAKVTAVDYRHKSGTGFSTMEELNDVQIDHIQTNIYDIPDNIGKFDIVLCLGVIYHLPDIPRALWKLTSFCQGRLMLESYVESFDTDFPMARYYEADTLAGDLTNFWAPNVHCMQAMMRDCGFSISKTETWGDRALVIGEVGGSASLKMSVAYISKMTG